MSDVLDRLDPLVPDADEVRLDPAWASVQRRTARARHRRQGAAALAAAAVVVVGLLAGQALSGDDDATRVTTEPEPDSSPSAIELEEGWNELPPIPGIPRTNPALAELDDGDLFLWGGYLAGELGIPLPDGAVLDAETGEWQALAPAPEVSMNEAEAVWTGEQVVLVPSSGTEPFVPLVWTQDDGTWLEGAIGSDGCGSRGSAWTGSEVVLACNNGVFQAYDPALDQWRQLPDPPVAYSDAGVVWTGDLLVAFGRSEPFDLPAGDGTAVTYDPSTDTWGEPFRAPVNAQATSITWTGEEVVAVNYDMEAGAFDPATGEGRELPPVPLRFYECTPKVVLAGETPIANLCSGSAVLGPNGRWTTFQAPPAFLAGAVSGTEAVYGTDDTGQVLAYRPPAPDGDGRIPFPNEVPLGISTFRAPPGFEVIDAALEEVSTAARNELAVGTPGGRACEVASTYLPVMPGNRSDERQVEVVTADGEARGAVSVTTEEGVTVDWRWSADLFTDTQSVTCPTEQLAIELASGFAPPPTL